MNVNSVDMFYGVFMTQEQQTLICTIRQSGTLPLAFAFIHTLRGKQKSQHGSLFSRRGNLDPRSN